MAARTFGGEQQVQDCAVGVHNPVSELRERGMLGANLCALISSNCALVVSAGLVAAAVAVVIEVIYAAIRARHGIA
jgi:hypothetical protein